MLKVCGYTVHKSTYAEGARVNLSRKEKIKFLSAPRWIKFREAKKMRQNEANPKIS